MATGSQEDKIRLGEILQRGEYNQPVGGAQGSPIRSWLTRLWQGLLDLFPEGAIRPGASRALAIITLLIMVAVLVFIIARLLYRVFGMRREERGRAGVFAEDTLLARTSEELLAEAEAYAGQGDYREAVRRGFLAALLRMNERGWVQTEAWKTNAEYADELRTSRAVWVARFGQGARIFERVYYGSELAGETDYSQLGAILSPLWAEGGDR